MQPSATTDANEETGADRTHHRRLATTYPRRLSNEDAREITENLTGFFTILAQWSRQEGRDRADATASGGRGGRRMNTETLASALGARRSGSHWMAPCPTH